MRMPNAIFAGLCVLLAACGPDKPVSDDRPKLCQTTTFCAVPAPPPENLQIAERAEEPGRPIRSQLAADFGEARILFRVGPKGENEWTDRKGVRHRGLRLYFATRPARPDVGSIWVVFDHATVDAPETQILVRDLDRRKIRVIVDGRTEGNRGLAFVAYRIAVVDSTTGIGPTFLSRDGQQPYIRYEYNSDYVRKDWEQMITSSCGGGPLTATPRAWTLERERLCAP